MKDRKAQFLEKLPQKFIIYSGMKRWENESTPITIINLNKLKIKLKGTMNFNAFRIEEKREKKLLPIKSN